MLGPLAQYQTESWDTMRREAYPASSSFISDACARFIGHVRHPEAIKGHIGAAEYDTKVVEQNPAKDNCGR